MALFITHFYSQKNLNLSDKDSFKERFENAYLFYYHSPKEKIEQAISDATSLGCEVTVADLAISLLVRDHHIDLQRATGYQGALESDVISFVSPPLTLYSHIETDQAAAVQDFLKKEKIPYSSQYLHSLFRVKPMEPLPVELLSLLEQLQSPQHLSETQQLAHTMLLLPAYLKYQSCLSALLQDSSEAMNQIRKDDLQRITLLLWLKTPWENLQSIIDLPLPQNESHVDTLEEGKKRALTLLKQQLIHAPEEAFTLLSLLQSWKEFIDLVPEQFLNSLLQKSPLALFYVPDKEKEALLQDILEKPWPQKTKSLARNCLENYFPSSSQQPGTGSSPGE